jgi:hypothetical protein
MFANNVLTMTRTRAHKDISSVSTCFAVPLHKPSRDEPGQKSLRRRADAMWSDADNNISQKDDALLTFFASGWAEEGQYYGFTTH